MAFFFWLFLGAMIHTYITYPFSLRLFKRKFKTPPVMPEGQWPTVAVLIAAYNEEKVIADKVKNCLSLDYEAGKLEIFIGSDGSTDRTNEIVGSFSEERVKFFDFGGRNGKPGVLNQLVEKTKAEILVMTDANVTILPNTFRNLIRHFSDKTVAGVATTKKITDGASSQVVAKNENRYAEHENHLKNIEGEIGGYSGALGSYYAMRRDCFHAFPLVPMNDDILALFYAVQSGMRVSFEPTAICYEDSAPSVAVEFKRRIRIGASNFKTLELCKSLLSPSRFAVAYTFFSHKVIRWIFPFLMIGVFTANLFLLDEPLYQWTFILQLLGYTVAAMGWLLGKMKFDLPIYSQLYHFVALNIALFLGFFVYLKGIKSAAWERTERTKAL